MLKHLHCLLVGLVLAVVAWPAGADEPADVPGPDASGAQPAHPPPMLPKWLNPSGLPFIPIPEIATDPNGGTTVGILPVWLKTDDEHAIRRIIAPDLFYNQYFGWGFHGRLYEYTSEDEQSSLVAGLQERVQRQFEAAYQRGRLRQHRWSFVTGLTYDKDGTPRFFGIGNGSREIAQTNYTAQQEALQGQIGLNFSPIWQLLYTVRYRSVDVLPGTLANIASIQSRFANVRGLGTNHEQLNRVALIYDTRDNLTAPRSGTAWVIYGGAASRGGAFNGSLYTEAGIDGRNFLPLSARTILATHISLRYLPSANRLPFWALSSVGGGESDIGGDQPLRGYGAGRFYDRNAFSGTAELRHTYWSFDAMDTHVDLEIAPFVDLGRVFAHGDEWPITQLHKVAGVGFRGIARPSVVGYVDIGYGSEGAAVFTGLNYPF
ncbi:MAG TPA: hypothetical protein VIY54_05695 [Steroidobacteraceae bacterium]